MSLEYINSLHEEFLLYYSLAQLLLLRFTFFDRNLHPIIVIKRSLRLLLRGDHYFMNWQGRLFSLFVGIIFIVLNCVGLLLLKLNHLIPSAWHPERCCCIIFRLLLIKSWVHEHVPLHHILLRHLLSPATTTLSVSTSLMRLRWSGLLWRERRTRNMMALILVVIPIWVGSCGHHRVMLHYFTSWSVLFLFNAIVKVWVIIHHLTFVSTALINLIER